MNSLEALKIIREYFQKDYFSADNGAIIETIDEGTACCSMKLTEHHKNAVGAVMGGAIFMLADFAFAVASNWKDIIKEKTEENLSKEVTVHVSRTNQITFLGGVKGGQLVATARRMKEGRHTCYYLVEVTDELGTQVAHVTVDGFVKQMQDG